MATFSDREKAFETKFAHDQETEFKACARRSRLLGLWAAEQMGLTDEDADAYAAEVVDRDIEKKGDEEVFEKVWGDLKDKVPDMSEHRVRREMEQLLVVARNEIRKG